MEGVGHHAGAAGIGEKLGAEADQAAGGNDELEAVDAVHRVHGDHFRLARAELLDDRPLVFFGDVDHQVLHRLAADAVDLAEDDLGLGDRQLVPFAAHVLDEDRQVQLAAARRP